MTVNEKFEILCSRLADIDTDVRSVTDFARLCKDLDVEPDWVDNMLYGIFGMSAEEIIRQYQADAVRLAM